VKYRACRDNVPVATGAMEMRGGNGYVEDWANAKLIRDAHLGLIWEGTSSVNALDIIRRAAGRERAHAALAGALHGRLDQAPIPETFRARLAALIDRAVGFVDKVAKLSSAEASCRRAASALYHATSAALLAAEGAELGSRGGAAQRLLLARLVLDHRLGSTDPFALPDDGGENAVSGKRLSDDPVPLPEAAALLAA
jgi:acyl-CoA dehydrogenase